MCRRVLDGMVSVSAWGNRWGGEISCVIIVQNGVWCGVLWCVCSILILIMCGTFAIVFFKRKVTISIMNNNYFYRCQSNWSNRDTETPKSFIHEAQLKLVPTK